MEYISAAGIPRRTTTKLAREFDQVQRLAKDGLYKLSVDGQTYVAQFSMKNEVAFLTWEQFTAYDPKPKKAAG